MPAADYLAEGLALLDRSSGEFPSGASQLEVTVDDEVYMEIPTAASEVLVKGIRAAQAREGWTTWEGSPGVAKGGSAASKVQKATSVDGKVARRSCCADVAEMDGFLKVLGRCLLAVSVAAQVWDGSHIQPQVR